MEKIISATPVYVWFILAYLIFVGIKSTKDRIVPISRLFILPALTLIWRHKVIFSEESTRHLLTTMLSMGFGIFIAINSRVYAIKDTYSVKLPGHYFTLIILLSFFCVRYFFVYINAANSELYDRYSFLEPYIVALFSGYFLGRALYCAFIVLKKQKIL